MQLFATGTFSDGTKQNVTSSATWTSSNTGVASVGAGLVRGLAAGSTQITRYAWRRDQSRGAHYRTSATLKSIAVTPSSLAIAAGTFDPVYGHGNL